MDLEQTLDEDSIVPTQEEEDELPKTIRYDAVLHSTDWTAETVVSQLNQGNINVKPKFQRRDAWDPLRKSKFIESLFLGIPIPQVVLAERERGEYIVLDGKQRLLTLLHFTGAEAFYSKPLRLKGLQVRTDLNGLTWRSLCSQPEFRSSVREFQNHSIRTVIIRDWSDESYLHEVFLRLNSGSLPLSPQELRSALHPGPFVDFIDQESAGNSALQEIMRLKEPDFRMRDAELELRLLAFDLRLPLYGGNLRSFLDDTCKLYNERWVEAQGELLASSDRIVTALHQIILLFGSNAARRWNGEHFERALNRAILDALVFAFKQPDIAAAALAQPEASLKVYKEVCLMPDFEQAVISTTKTPESICTRLRLFTEKLSTTVDVRPRLPRLVENRIVLD